MKALQKHIVVVGSINMDFVVRTERTPKPGETVAGYAFETHFGGKGANQAVAVASLDYPVEMIGMVGSDIFGNQMREGLKRAGVGVRAVGTAEGATGVAAINVSRSGDNSIVVVPGANDHVSPEYVDLHKELIREAGLVLLQLEIPSATVAHVTGLCRRYGVEVMLDPAPAKILPQSVLAGVSWFTPNETEAAFFAQQISPNLVRGGFESIAHALSTLNVGAVVLKQGARGIVLVQNEMRVIVPAIQVEALDTTAAGDAFNGAFATALMLGMEPEAAAQFACAAAAVSVTRRGAQPSMPSRAEVEEVLRRSERVRNESAIVSAKVARP